MKTYRLNAAILVVAICLVASSGRGQILEDSVRDPGSTTSVNGNLNTGLFVPTTAAYLWKTIYIDDQPKPGFAGLAVDSAGNVYGTKGCAIVRITPDGRMTTVAGTAESA